MSTNVPAPTPVEAVAVEVHPAPAVPIQPPYVGAYRTAKPPPCRLSNADLKALFKLLERKAAEAAARVIAQLPETGPQGRPRAEMVEVVREVLFLRASVEGTNGEQIRGITDPSGFDEGNLTFTPKRITYDNAAALRARGGNHPDNWVQVQLDFATPPLLDLSSPSDEPTPNESMITVAGDDTTWVTGVFTEVQGFFESRRLRRGWLHAKHSYDVLLLFIGLPLTFRLIHLVSQGYGPWLSSIAPTLSVAVYIYLFFVFLYLFRAGFGVVRWLYPLVELRGTRSVGRHAVTFVIGAVAVKLVVDIVKGLVVAAAKGLTAP